MAHTFDAFGKTPQLYYRGNSHIVSVSGCCCTIFILISCIGFLAHDIMSYPELAVNAHTTVNTGSDYNFNPFTENAFELSFGVTRSAEAKFESFDKF